MDISDLVKSIGSTDNEEISRRLNKLVRENYRYKNLDEGNKNIILEIIKDLKDDYLRQGKKVPAQRLQDESHRLYKNRIALGLTEEDLKDIKEILASFK